MMRCSNYCTALTFMLFFSLMLTACAPPVHLSADYGRSYDAVFTSQIAHPDAPQNPGPVDVTPGEMANKIYKNRYDKAYTKEAKDDDESSEGLSGKL